MQAESPEELDELRQSVRSWLTKSREAVKSFYDENTKSFLRDSEPEQPKSKTAISLTTTARCFMALAYAERTEKRPDESWRKWLSEFLQDKRFWHRGDKFFEVSSEGENSGQAKDKKQNNGESLNNFDLAHLADFAFANFFDSRFPPKAAPTIKHTADAKRQLKQIEEKLPKAVAGLLSCCGSDGNENRCNRGQLFFDDEETKSKHFFVTLHALRTLAIMKAHRANKWGDIEKAIDFKDLVDEARRYCVEQCFYQNQGLGHFRDPARLVFAGAIYCMFARNPERRLTTAIVEVLADRQDENGTWATTHPIIRKDKSPWYIASHEVALCLTWLYFQPSLPAETRRCLLVMMRRFFESWLVPTYIELPKGDNQKSAFAGWYDDSKAGHDIAVGWTTAIACHFLANYLSVLDDFINRRVIETLGLHQYAKRYRIDAAHPEHNPRWLKEREGSHLPVWPDLPPFAWDAECSSENDFERSLARDIAWNWTDPTVQEDLSKALARKMLGPVKRSPAQRPVKNAVSCMFPGSPGTRKTSLVKTLSKILDWPFVPVPASVIFERGFDGMESQATLVFRRLNYLTGCVIFFDEFEEFFIDRSQAVDRNKAKKETDNKAQKNIDGKQLDKRKQSLPYHDRTIAAFTTSAMLPRLQELNDEERCLVFFATNHPDKIDSAIKRPGRIDFQAPIDHPLIQRFIGENSYLEKQTETSYDALGIEVDGEKRAPSAGQTRRIARIRNLLERALTYGKVKKALGEDKVRSQLKSSDDDKATGQDIIPLRIKFAFVEGALKVAAAQPKNDTKARHAVRDKLLECIQDLKNIKGGPEPLISKPRRNHEHLTKNGKDVT